MFIVLRVCFQPRGRSLYKKTRHLIDSIQFDTQIEIEEEQNNQSKAKVSISLSLGVCVCLHDHCKLNEVTLRRRGEKWDNIGWNDETFFISACRRCQLTWALSGRSNRRRRRRWKRNVEWFCLGHCCWGRKICRGLCGGLWIFFNSFD